MVLYTYCRSFLTEDKGKDRWFCTLIVGRPDLRHGGGQMVLYTYCRSFTYGWSFLAEDKGEGRWFCKHMVGRSWLKTRGESDGSVHLL